MRLLPDLGDVFGHNQPGLCPSNENCFPRAVMQKPLPDLTVPACSNKGVRCGLGWQMCGPGTWLYFPT